MLPPFIIEQIRKREEDERRKQQESVLQLPLPERPLLPRPDRDPPLDRERERDRGVVIIEF